VETEQSATGATQGKEPWTLQKKIVVAIIGIAIIVLAAVVVAKFVFNVNLLDPSWLAMARRRR